MPKVGAKVIREREGPLVQLASVGPLQLLGKALNLLSRSYLLQKQSHLLRGGFCLDLRFLCFYLKFIMLLKDGDRHRQRRHHHFFRYIVLFVDTFEAIAPCKALRTIYLLILPAEVFHHEDGPRILRIILLHTI